MIITITLALSFLVAINFLLLIFSCNKSSKKISQQKPTIVSSVNSKKETKQLASIQLAPTGS
jgi:hypothetical protein